MAKILITDGNSRITLSVLRSLSSRGFEVVVGSDKRRCLSFFSKYCKKKILYPNPCLYKKQFVDFMLDYVKNNHVDVLIPICDTTVIPISEKIKSFGKYTTIACPENKILKKSINKSKTINIAQRKGIPVPKTYFVKSIDELKKLSSKLNFPVIIKPRYSCFWKGDEINYGYSEVVFDKSSLITKYVHQHNLVPYPLIQEFIQGRGYGISVIAKEGKPVAIFSHKRLKQVPINGVVSCLRISVKPPPDMKKYALRLLKELKWNGVAMVEFILDKKDNIPKLMEINGRFWGSLELAISSGIDFPYIFLKLFYGETLNISTRYKIGHKCRWLKGDLFYLLLILKSKKKSLGYKMKQIMSYIQIFERNMSYDIFKLNDILPGVFENAQGFYSLLNGQNNLLKRINKPTK